MRTALTAILLAVLSVLGAVVSPWAAAASECPSRAATLMAMGLRPSTDCGTAPGGGCGNSCGVPKETVASGCCAAASAVTHPTLTCCGSEAAGVNECALAAGSAGYCAASEGSTIGFALGCGEDSSAAPIRGCRGCRASPLSALTAIDGTTRSRVAEDAGQEPARVVIAAVSPRAQVQAADAVQSDLVLDSSRRRALLCIRTI